MKKNQLVGSDIKIKIKNRSVCYNDYGNGEIPILFLHGFPFDKSSWQLQMEALKKTNRVIAYDIRGFGASEAPPGQVFRCKRSVASVTCRSKSFNP